jgi:transcriptional regulator
VAEAKADILQGTLDLMVLKTLDSMGPLHGYGIARRIEQVSEQLLQMNQGTLYPALMRLQQRRLIAAKWGVSDTHRRVKLYYLTEAGRRQLTAEADKWERMSAVMVRILHGPEHA